VHSHLLVNVCADLCCDLRINMRHYMRCNMRNETHVRRYMLSNVRS